MKLQAYESTSGPTSTTGPHSTAPGLGAGQGQGPGISSRVGGGAGGGASGGARGGADAPTAVAAGHTPGADHRPPEAGQPRAKASRSITRVRIFYPADPVGVVPGGIDTFIRGLIKFAPPDLSFSLVGMTTDPRRRPVGRWTTCDIGGRRFEFWPAVAVSDAGGRTRIPLSLRYTAAVRRHRDALMEGFDVFDFHRPEPSLLFRADARAKNAFFHQDPGDVSARKSDMLWRHMPGLYQSMEAVALDALDRIWCVRESGVDTLRARFPGAPERVQFIPTWVDTEVFHPAEPAQRQALRRRLAREHGLDEREPWIITVGRLDTQKDPNLMLEAFKRVCARRPARWLVVGDGVLRPELERRIAAARLGDRVHLLGLRSAPEVGELLRAADLYALSSAYEGMPMALLEALGSGLPVVTTAVGEVRRVVHPGINGAISANHEPDAFAAVLLQGLDQRRAWRGAPALAAIQDYQPAVVLAQAYQAYRDLRGDYRRRRRLVARQQEADPAMRPRRTVLGIPVDALSRSTVRARVLHWARQHESRYVCFCNVHSVVTATQQGHHHLALQGADLALPDGAPIAWTLRAKGRSGQQRVDGPGLMWQLCADAQTQGIRVGLYGSTATTLALLNSRLQQHFPRLQVSYLCAPPFRPLTREEDDAAVQAIQKAGVGLLFVGLGCPKQEAWMADHRGRIGAVMLGVGAAFDFHAGLARRAPTWMRHSGLEWLHRLAGNPRRLAGRYLRTNTMFAAKTAADWLSRERPKAVESMLSVASVPATALTLTPESELLPMRGVTQGIDEAAIDDLVGRVDAALDPRKCRVIEFVASSRGEGTSTLASAFASANAEQWQRRVLLLVTSGDAPSATALLHQLTQGGRIADVLQARDDGVHVARIGRVGAGEPGWRLLRKPEVWTHLRRHFDLVVLDMPPIEKSRAGLKVAVACDGVVVVVEAERTRAPVVRDLVDRLRAVRGNVLGTVLNKRRYHLPGRLYHRL